MNTVAPLTGRPPRAVIRTRTVIGAVRLVTGFGENCTDATTRRSPAACSSRDRHPAVRGRRRLVRPDDTRRVRDRRRRATIVPRDDADADRPARVGIAHLVARVVRTLDLAAVVALVVAAKPDVRVGDRLSPAHWPRFAWSVLPTRAVPVIEGSVVLTGLAAVTMFVGFDVAVSWPSSFRAITCERMRKPASP